MVFSQWIVTISCCQKITWDELGALMNQLVESVLSIGSRLPPNNGSS